MIAQYLVSVQTDSLGLGSDNTSALVAATKLVALKLPPIEELKDKIRLEK